MYLPTHFREDSLDTLYNLIEAHPLGCLVTSGAAGLDANHLPFDLDRQPAPSGVLRAHIARANPLWRAVEKEAEVLVIFQAEQGYISPNWYPSKQDTHKQVPTWNYRVVHAYGRISFHEDPAWIRALLIRLTDRHESAQPRPWTLEESPPEFIARMIGAVVGVEITLSRVLGKAKLSQNREDRDRAGAATALQAQGNAPLAAAVRATLPPDFDNTP